VPAIRGHEPETHNRISRAQRRRDPTPLLAKTEPPAALYFQCGLSVWFEIKVTRQASCLPRVSTPIGGARVLSFEWEGMTERGNDASYSSSWI
jgi:hypothetical protein